MTRILAKSLYALLAAVFLVAGGSVLLLGTGLLPVGVRNLIVDIGGGDGHALHILQGFSSLMIFAGLITLWFLRHYEQSRPFHWAVTVFWALFAWVHWYDTHGHFNASLEPLTTTVPLIVFLVV